MLTEEQIELRLKQEQKIEPAYEGSQPNGKFRAKLTKLPVFGPLFNCSDPQIHIDSFTEIFYTFFFATVPIWLGAVLGYGYMSTITTAEEPLSIVHLLKNGIGGGELFIISTSLLAPVLFSMWQDPKDAKPFPSKISIGLVVVLIMFLSTGFFSAAKANPMPNKSYLLSMSIVVFIAALVIRYLSLVYHKDRIQNPDYKYSENQLQHEMIARRNTDG